jgi:hypothetical protein
MLMAAVTWVQGRKSRYIQVTVACVLASRRR